MFETTHKGIIKGCSITKNIFSSKSSYCFFKFIKDKILDKLWQSNQLQNVLLFFLDVFTFKKFEICHLRITKVR